MKYRLKEIYSISNEKIETSFHDLTVENKNSYTANRYIVHNCLTTQQTGVGYPMASLINECSKMKLLMHNAAGIVADGGFKSYSDIIKALALGADYVMLGSILNKTLESSGDTFEANRKHDSWTQPGAQVNQYSEEVGLLFKAGNKFYKKFRGMSTKEAQIAMGKETLTTSEGVNRMQVSCGLLNGSFHQ